MNDISQAFWGMLAAILSSILVFGGLMISLTEGGLRVASAPTPTPTVTQRLPTQKPGEPTYTPSPTPLPTSTATASVSIDCEYPPGWVEVVVEVGDTLPGLADRYNLSEGELRKANCMETNGLPAGTTIHIPSLPPTATPLPSDTPTMPPPLPEPTRRATTCPRPPGWVIYIVKKGDTLYRIGLTYGINYRMLMDRNCLRSDTIRVGQRLYIPNVPPIPPSNTPIPYHTPTFIPPVYTPTSVPPTVVPPTATSVPSTSTPALLPTETVSPPTETNTPPPVATATSTTIPTISNPPTNTPPNPPTLPPLPSATSTSIPAVTRIVSTLIIATPGRTIDPP